VPNATVDGRELFYLRRGAGEPLLLIMGLSGNHLHWGDPFLEQLDDSLEAITYDHRGLGKSAQHDGSFTIADLAEDAAGLLDAVQLESAHVMGCSMGGMVAQELAVRHPERVRTLVLGCTYAGGEGSALTDRAIIEELTSVFLSGGPGAAMQEMLRFNFSAEFFGQADKIEPFKQIALQLPASIEVLMAQLQATAAHDASARLAEITAPTLIIHGSADQILPVSNAHHIAGLMPDARLEVLEGVGHLFWWEQPERAADLVREHAAVAARQ
jgi:3-oxoadipate enol-lactonase